MTAVSTAVAWGYVLGGLFAALFGAYVTWVIFRRRAEFHSLRAALWLPALFVLAGAKSLYDGLHTLHLLT